jgi:hypothetical protein
MFVPNVVCHCFNRIFLYRNNLLFFLFILIFSQVVVSAGVFRVFGPEVAELPLVATDAEYQGQVI